GPIDPGDQFWETYPILDTSLYGRGATIAGYSALLSPACAGLQCASPTGQACSAAVDSAVAPVAPTGRSLIDLMGVGEVDIERADDAARFVARAGDSWTPTSVAGGGVRYSRLSREGQVTWASPGAFAVTRQADPARIVIEARNDAAQPGRLVVARAWYPAWRATLNGAPVRAAPLDGALIAVDLPPASRGTLVVTYWPEGLTLGLVLAAMGALVLAISALMPTPFERAAMILEKGLNRRQPGTSAQA
ncbi:MAG TPA: hypothetical protein VGF71_11035, partial [Caulobacteraceae bacterium]